MASSEGTPLINKRRLSKRRHQANRECQALSGTVDPDASPDSLECCNLDPINTYRSSSRLYSQSHKFEKIPDLESGHVVQKISAYEENSCCNRQERRIDSRLGMTEIKKHKKIGVPLVGMHNACGLPVIAHWQTSRLSKSSARRPVSRSHRHSRSQSQTHPRSRPCQDSGELNLKQRWLPKEGSRHTSARKKVTKRPSFKASRVGTFPAKKVFKTVGRDFERESMIFRLGGSFGRRSGKRTTLYAKDRGEEAVNALKKLCLNPLARNNKGDVMMW